MSQTRSQRSSSSFTDRPLGSITWRRGTIRLVPIVGWREGTNATERAVSTTVGHPDRMPARCSQTAQDGRGVRVYDISINRHVVDEVHRWPPIALWLSRAALREVSVRAPDSKQTNTRY